MLPVQLSVNSVAAQKQSLQSISEQMVSITRTKIQELRAENPDRRLILIGMNSASALAMQVALVEQVSGVICFGFSYHTVHGVRGQADDHLLDLTTPVLFLIGQNAARSSEEEIEYFREKLSAPSTLCVVGSGDDFLRVSKTKRRLEGVTQEMVDNMIVDEMAEFATNCVKRPVPPKPKTSVPLAIPRREIDLLNGPIRKRKTSGEMDGVKLPVKTLKLMRPTSTSDDMLDLAVQSILPDSEEKALPRTVRFGQKFGVTSRPIAYDAEERIPVQTIKSGMKQQSVTLKLPPKPRAFGPAKYITITSAGGQKFGQIQARPTNSRPSTPTYILNSRAVTNGKSQLAQQQNFSPTKYTIVRASAGNPNNNIQYINDGDLSTNILDMPIVFADNDGNIDEEGSDNGSVISIASDSPPAVGKQVTLKSTTIASAAPAKPNTYTLTKNKNILIQRPAQGKMVMINGTQVVGKQLSNNIVIAKQQVPKFTHAQRVASIRPQITHQTGKKIEILNNTIIKPASSGTTMTKVQSGSFVNLADAKPIAANRLSLPNTSTSALKKQIVIKTNALKPYTGAQIIPTQLGASKIGNLTVKRLSVVPSPAIVKSFKKN